MVDWKKDIKLSDLLARQSDDVLPVHEHEATEPGGEGSEQPESERRSFFRRELSFGRGENDLQQEHLADAHASDHEHFEPVAADVADVSAAGDEPALEKQPFFKRELSFGRRKADPAEAEFETIEEESGDPDEATPFWKRELSFRRTKPEQSQDPDFEVTTEEPEPKKDSFFKRELSFRRRQDDPQPEPPVEPEHEEPDQEQPEPAVAAATEADPGEATPFWKRELSFRRTKPEHSPDSDFEVTTEEPEPKKDSFFKRELSFRRRQDDTQPDPPVEHANEEPEHEQPEHDEPEPVMAAPPEAQPFTPPEEPENRPFAKRFSFGTKDSVFEAPKPPRRPFRRRERSSHRHGDADFDTPKSEKRPFWKRELSFPRRRVADTQPVATGRASRSGRKKHVVGLKVGASQIAAARVANNGSPELLQVARQPIEHGIVVGGELRDPDALADSLRDFFANHKLPNRNVRLGIGNNRIGVRTFEISGVHDPKQLENAIRFRAQEALPIPLDEAVLDYHVIDEAVSPTGIRTYRVLLVVAYRELVDRYVAACRSAGLRLVGIDLEAFALLRALSPPPSEVFPEDTALVAVAIGHDRSTFAVSNGAVCEFTRVLDWGGASLNTAIARALDITPSQAEPVKRTLTLSNGEDGATDTTNEHAVRAEEAVRVELQSFARELVSSLHFYQNQPGSLAVGSIALTGGTAHLPGLAAELQRLIGVKVRVGDPLRRVKTAKRIEGPDQLGSFAVAIGLGIED
jgi:type IV pilus assembly protein PilM